MAAVFAGSSGAGAYPDSLTFTRLQGDAAWRVLHQIQSGGDLRLRTVRRRDDLAVWK